MYLLRPQMGWFQEPRNKLREMSRHHGNQWFGVTLKRESSDSEPMADELNFLTGGKSTRQKKRVHLNKSF